MNLFSKMFTKESPKQKAIKLLEKAAKEGDLQAQQMIMLYRTLESEYFCPIQDSINALHDEKTVDNIIQCIKSTSKPIKKSKPRRRGHRNRNPKKRRNVTTSKS